MTHLGRLGSLCFILRASPGVFNNRPVGAYFKIMYGIRILKRFRNLEPSLILINNDNAYAPVYF